MALLVIAVLTAAAAAQPDERGVIMGGLPDVHPLTEDQRTPTDITLEPAHRIAFEGSDTINAVVFSPDGKTAYVATDGRSVDLWAAAVSIWPELLGGLSLLVFLVWVWRLTRVRKRPQERGAPHCRKCNYNVIAQAPDAAAALAERRRPAPGTRCPECGVDLSKRPPRRGRSMTLRVWLSTTIAALCVLGYAGLHAMGVPRTGPAARWGQWWSDTVDRLADKYQVAWLNTHRVGVTRFMIVDSETGRVRGRLCSRRGSLGPGAVMASPDGRNLAVASSDEQLRWISTRTGWTRERVLVDGQFPFEPGSSALLGCSEPQDPWVWCVVVDQARGLSRVLRWRPSSGERVVVVEESAHAEVMNNGMKRVFARRCALLPWPTETGLATWPSFMAIANGGSAPVQVLGGDGALIRSIMVGARFAALSPLVVTPDGERLFVSGAHEGIFGFDLNTGESLGVLKTAMLESPEHSITISADGSRLFVPVLSNAVLVRDINQRRWSARLNFPKGFINPVPSTSPDGRWLAITPFRVERGKGPGGRDRFIRELFLYDLAPLSTTKPK